jgi:hypothetical protein
MNDLMAIFGVIRLILFKNQRFFSSYKRACAFHNDEVINDIVQDLQAVRQ